MEIFLQSIPTEKVGFVGSQYPSQVFLKRKVSEILSDMQLSRNTPVWLPGNWLPVFPYLLHCRSSQVLYSRLDCTSLREKEASTSIYANYRFTRKAWSDSKNVLSCFFRYDNLCSKPGTITLPGLSLSVCNMRQLREELLLHPLGEKTKQLNSTYPCPWVDKVYRDRPILFGLHSPYHNNIGITLKIS